MRTVGLLCAVFASLAYGIGSVAQAAGVGREAAPSPAATTPAPANVAARTGVARLVASPLFVLGLGFDALGFVASLVALRELPLFAVQSLLATSLAVTVVLARLVLKARMRHLDLVAVAVAALACAVTASAAGTAPAVRPPRGFGLVAVLAATVVVVAGVGLAHRRAAPGLLALVSGIAQSVQVLSARGLSLAGVSLRHPLAAVGTLAGEPLAWSLAVAGATGIVLYGLALERGGVGTTTAILWVVEIVVPTVCGLGLLGDTVQHGWRVALVVALAAAVAATMPSPGRPRRSDLVQIPLTRRPGPIYGDGVQQQPARWETSAVALVLQTGWRIVETPTYWPVGSAVITGVPATGSSPPRRVRVRALETALGAAAAVGAPVAVTPVPAVDGSLVQRAAGATFVLHPFVDGTCHGFGHVLDEAQAFGVVALLADLHSRRVPADPEDSRLLLNKRGGSGPYRRRVDSWLAAHGGRLERALADDARVAAGIDRSQDVLTHGEPHPGNLLETAAGWRLLDWDTARLAPAERDLWRLVDDLPDAADEYERRAGRHLRPDVLAHYRRRWDLADVVSSVEALCADHRAGEDSALSWQVLTTTEF